MPEHTPAPTPARSLYGFSLYVFSKILLGVYCAWAFVPDSCLHYLNIYYYPQKYWSTAVPIQLLIALTTFAFLIYPSLNLIIACNTDSVHTILDNYSSTYINSDSNNKKIQKCVCIDDSKCMKNRCIVKTKEHSVPQLYDLDVRDVCKMLYLRKNN